MLQPQIVQGLGFAAAGERVLERVRSVVIAEYPQGLAIERDYDASLPDFRGDKEQLIQAVQDFQAGRLA